MTHVPHEIADEFPEHKDLIHELKSVDAHFSKLLDAYHEVNRAVHRMETNIEPVAQETEEDARKHRMKLKDEIYAILGKSKASA